MINNYQYLIERVLLPKSKSGNEILYACPVCEDLSIGHHLHVNYVKGYFHCVKCDYGGRSLVFLLKKLGIDRKFDYESLESSYADELSEIVKEDILSTKEKRIVEYSRNLKLLTEYYLSHTKELSNISRNYLNMRGFSNWLIDMMCIREGVNLYGIELNIRGKKLKGRDYSNRVIIPSIRKDGLISYYTARDITGTKKNKYINCNSELAYSSEDVYNLDMIDSDYVIICEGALSALSIIQALKKNVAVATYGKSIASRSNTENKQIIVSSQGEKLLSKKFHCYYVFYDKDAFSSTINTCKYLYDRGAYVRYITISTDKYGEKADANDMTEEEIIYSIKNSKEYTNFIEIENLF